MTLATSAGGIFVKRENGKDLILLLKHVDTPGLGFFKGHVETGETIEQAALREVEEESGIKNATIIKRIGEFQRNSREFNGEVEFKTIHIFLMKFSKPQNLHPDADWFEYYEAISKMSFPQDAQFLKEHKNDILGHE